MCRFMQQRYFKNTFTFEKDIRSEKVPDLWPLLKHHEITTEDIILCNNSERLSSGLQVTFVFFKWMAEKKPLCSRLR